MDTNIIDSSIDEKKSDDDEKIDNEYHELAMVKSIPTILSKYFKIDEKTIYPHIVSTYIGFPMMDKENFNKLSLYVNEISEFSSNGYGHVFRLSSCILKDL